MKLIIETSHERSLVAFENNGNLLLTLPLPAGLQSSAHLFPKIMDGMRELGCSIDDVTVVAVSVGPGSFTGIRVGVAAAKGIAVPRRLPILKLCSLHGFVGEGNYISLIDARSAGAFVYIPGDKAKLVSNKDLPRLLEGYSVIVGPNLGRFSDYNICEKYPDPAELLKNPLPCVPNELDLLYLV